MCKKIKKVKFTTPICVNRYIYIEKGLEEHSANCWPPDLRKYDVVSPIPMGPDERQAAFTFFL